ncbi:MAG TPA: type VI secretion system baseplate subunit TssF, partial [Pirellulaceae bacterium]|nr:type VI secretion system baseplate subunit TssF [Pirellulaceae bacterium]
MSEELREYYERELTYFRSLGAEFADRYKKIAGRLRLGPTESKDPHVERLLQGMALLTARVRRKLDDDFPEIAEALFSVVYPHYLRPIPSLAIVQFALGRGQAELFAGHEVVSGTKLEVMARPLDRAEELCAYRTCYPTRVWPVKVESATLKSRPFVAPRNPHVGVRAVLHLKLKTLSPKAKLSDMKLTTLRFYLHGGAQQINVYKLYELIMQHSLGVAIAPTENADRPVLLDKSCLAAVGFAPEESLLPADPRTFQGYRLMTEFFALPQKHLFVDITGLTPQALAQLGETGELFIYLSRSDADLERYVSADTFRLGCTPVINLFEQQCSPAELTHQQTEYLLLPDVNRKSATEVYSINRVEVVGDSLRGVQHVPFFSFKHAADSSAARAFW